MLEIGKFENRIVACVDILDFSEQIEFMEQDPYRQDQVVGALQDALVAESGLFPRRVFEESLTTLVDDPPLPPRATSFSNRLLLSDDRGNVGPLIARVQRIALRFMGEGLAMGGALVEGLIHHTSHVVYGSALGAAQKAMEETPLPRIVVPASLAEEFHEQERLLRASREGLYPRSLIRRDSDGRFSVDAFVPAPGILDGEEMPSRARWVTHFRRMSDLLIRAVNYHYYRRDPDVLGRIYWNVERFNESVPTFFAEVPAIELPDWPFRETPKLGEE